MEENEFCFGNIDNQLGNESLKLRKMHSRARGARMVLLPQDSYPEGSFSLSLHRPQSPSCLPEGRNGGRGDGKQEDHSQLF